MLKENLSNMIKSEMSYYEKQIIDNYKHIQNPDSERMYYCPRPEDKFKSWRQDDIIDKLDPIKEFKEKYASEFESLAFPKKITGVFDNLTLDQLREGEKKYAALDTVEGYEKAARIRDEIKKRINII